MTWLLHQVPVPIAVFEAATGSFIVANQAWRDQGTLAGEIHPDDRPRFTHARDEAVAGTCSALEIRYRTRDNAWRWHHVYFLIPEGTKDRCVFVTTDIHDRRLPTSQYHEFGDKLARERAERAELEALTQNKDHFLSAVAHELRTPLMTMLMWEDVMRDEAAPPELRARALDAIHDSAMTQSRLVGDLVDFTRALTGKLGIDLRELDPHPIVEQAIAEARFSASAKQIHLDITVPRDLGMIGADARRLQQIVDNLLSNAIDLTQPGGRVIVITAAFEGAIRIAVRSEDVIVGPELERLFEPFSLRSMERDRPSGRLGVGLALARELAKLHDGTLTATRLGERGVELAFEIPKALATGKLRKLTGPSAILAGVRVLVVDDDPRVCEALARSISRPGADVTTVSSAAAARDALARATFDVLICDIAMTQEDGYSFMKWLRRQDGPAGALPAIALTAHAAASDAKLALEVGYQIHLGKPIITSQLVSTIHDLVTASAR